MDNQKDMKRLAMIIFDKLMDQYGKISTALEYGDKFQLLIAVVLSAQTTDKQVNRVTKKLFSLYPDAKRLAQAPVADVEDLIKSLGLYRRKSHAIIECARMVEDIHKGQVPCDRGLLMAMPGVGRKSASVILAIACNKPAFPVDTHVLRLANRLGLSDGKNPFMVEKDLKKIVPRTHWLDYHLLLINHGRRICKAQNPQCGICFLQAHCPSFEISAR